MAKTKTPFFGLGSQGSIGNTLTTQKRPGTTMVRAKPTPGYRRTLPQLYQRWLYQDYAYLWTQQSAATRAEYRSAGSRFHLTGFQYWMRITLLALPNISLWLKLDEKAGAVAHDSSSNQNNGTIFGATPISSVINGGQLLDGVNDRITMPNHPALNPTTHITIDFFFTSKYPTGSVVNYKYLFYKGAVSPTTTQWFCYTTSQKLRFFMLVGGVEERNIYSSNLIYNKPVHYTFLYNGSNVILYEDGIQKDIDPASGAIGITSTTLYLGHSSNPIHGILDNFCIHDRIQDLTEIIRHSERRYPA